MASIEQSYDWMTRYEWTIHKKGFVSANLLPDQEGVGEDTLEAAKGKLVEVTRDIALSIFGIQGSKGQDRIVMRGPLLKEIPVNINGKRGYGGGFTKCVAVYMLEGLQKKCEDKGAIKDPNAPLGKRLRHLEESLGTECRFGPQKSKDTEPGIIFDKSIILTGNTKVLVKINIENWKYRIVKSNYQSKEIGKLSPHSLELAERLKELGIRKIELEGRKCQLERGITSILETLLRSDEFRDEDLQEFADEHDLLIRVFPEDGGVEVYASVQYREELFRDNVEREREQQEEMADAANILTSIGQPSSHAGVEFYDDISRDDMILVEINGVNEHKVVNHLYQRRRAGFLTSASITSIEPLKQKYPTLNILLRGKRHELEGEIIVTILKTMLDSENLLLDEKLREFVEEHGLWMGLFGDGMEPIASYGETSSEKRARTS